MNADRIEAYLQATRPSCIQDFDAEPAHLPDRPNHNAHSAWIIACRCGGQGGRLLGYPLKDLRPEYSGPAIFVSPLSFVCVKCCVVTPLLDTNRDGYHAVVARLEGGSGSTKITGNGPPSAFLCPSCSGDSFELTVGFTYWDIDELAEDFDREWEALFNEFTCLCRCVRCGHVSEPTAFGKL
ncbi:MAG TPA: hypothetical protein P5081_05960 [Phycisphaerae bacterium]|nr:hypothetical protein [Phycisphaerae bacterium]HRW52412.1 hypothetical protein [Phycisphaerae bacterium]